MTKPLADKLYYTISEVSEHLDLAPSLLRYWEAEFNTIKPRRNKKGTRFYTKADIEQVKLIQLLVKDQGYTLQGARDKIKTEKTKARKQVELREGLQNLRSFIAELHDAL